MRIGTSLVLIAIGAILKFAVTTSVNGIDLNTVGVVLMVVGALGLVISMVMAANARRTEVVRTPGRVDYVEPVRRDEPLM
jgi:hypothetical protein